MKQDSYADCFFTSSNLAKKTIYRVGPSETGDKARSISNMVWLKRSRSGKISIHTLVKQDPLITVSTTILTNSKALQTVTHRVAM